MRKFSACLRALGLTLLVAAMLLASGGRTSAQVPAMPAMPSMGSIKFPAPKLGKSFIGPLQAKGSSSKSATRTPGIHVNIQTGDNGPEKLSTGLEIALFMTLLTLAPAIFLSLTSFTRIVIVLSFMKRAMSVQELPPSLVVTGFAFFLTLFIMKPTLTQVYDKAYVPYTNEEISIVEAAEIGSSVMGKFLSKQTRESDLHLMYDISREPYPDDISDVPFHLLVPAFVLSEIKTAFQMGFVLFLPFLVIDLVISSILISMGMFTLPPIVISTPFKVLLFILVDGWNLVIRSTIESFYL